MNEMWLRILNLIKRVACHPRTREFAEDLRRFLVEKMIAALEEVLRGREEPHLAVV